MICLPGHHFPNAIALHHKGQMFSVLPLTMKMQLEPQVS